MRIWITGIAGFLGSHLADALEGHEIEGNDNLICGDANNTKRAFWKTDCRNTEALTLQMELFKPDVVVHCAATAHEGLSSFSPSFITRNIYEASVSTFTAAIAAGAKRIVFMSSMARYGREVPPFTEDMPVQPVDPYGVAKVAAEDTLRILAQTHGIKYSILVPHNIVGARQRYNDPFRNVASIMINRALKGLPLIIYGDGKQERCFSPIKDCLPSIIRAVNGDADGEVVNIGPDQGEISINELARIVMHQTGLIEEPLYMPDRPNEVKVAYTSSDKARRLLGYQEVQHIEACIKEMIEDIKKKGTKSFDYSFPIEIEKGCPLTWKEKLI